MSEMIERVARAIGVPEQNGLVCEWSLKAARAAVEAMREATQTMTVAASMQPGQQSYADIWRTMIDEALK